VNNKAYSGRLSSNSSLVNAVVKKNDNIVWNSDFSVTKTGWKICDVSAPPQPQPPPPPPPLWTTTPPHHYSTPPPAAPYPVPTPGPTPVPTPPPMPLSAFRFLHDNICYGSESRHLGSVSTTTLQRCMEECYGIPNCAYASFCPSNSSQCSGWHTNRCVFSGGGCGTAGNNPIYSSGNAMGGYKTYYCPGCPTDTTPPWTTQYPQTSLATTTTTTTTMPLSAFHFLHDNFCYGTERRDLGSFLTTTLQGCMEQCYGILNCAYASYCSGNSSQCSGWHTNRCLLYGGGCGAVGNNPGSNQGQFDVYKTYYCPGCPTDTTPNTTPPPYRPSLASLATDEESEDALFKLGDDQIAEDESDDEPTRDMDESA